jgi:hypothetical protein
MVPMPGHPMASVSILYKRGEKITNKEDIKFLYDQGAVYREI